MPLSKIFRLAPGVRWYRSRRVWAAAAAVFILIGIFVFLPFWRLTSQFDDLTFRQPSRLYGRATRLYPGRSYPADRLVREIEGEGYREYEGPRSPPAGTYVRTKSGITIHLRSFPTPERRRRGGVVEITYGGSRVKSLAVDGKKAEEAILDPPLLASYYGEDNQERQPLELDEVAEDLVQAVIAAEDDNFFDHSGVSFSGIARALWKNMRGGGIRQGGSTLTQQLVKNLYLTHERTLTRKSQEVLLALLLELRYSKREILAAYLNEIYLGGSGGVSLLGMGAASRAYFGKDASQLDLGEAATLAGMIRAPAHYSPLTHPDRAKVRRDWVLQRMAQLKLAEPARIEQALASPLEVSPEPVVRRRAPYFADAMALEAQRRYGIEDLADSGYVLFSTLDWRNQQAAQAAVEKGLESVEKGYQKGHKGEGPLQAALVSVDPENGGILAYVGGRNYRESQFDRAGQAKRQPGSAFKPIVYAAAFEARAVSPTSPLEDEPLTVRTPGGKDWSPKNDDGQFHGQVTVRRAIERSYNPATARLAMKVGLPEVVELAHAMGIVEPMDPFPSVALGSVGITPVELSTVYATLASGGVRPAVHGLVAVVDRYGERVTGTALPEPERVLSPQSAYLVTSLLEGVVRHGTGYGAAAGTKGDVAGKTGTTNKRRDSWFGGYSPDRATVVWVGYDDNSSTRLSGARAALPIWNRFTAAVVPPNGFSTFEQPPGLTTAVIDPTTGMLATEYCPSVLTEVFRKGDAPSQLCDLHQSYAFDGQMADAVEAGEDGIFGTEDDGVPAEDPAGPQDEKRHPFRRWLNRVFGSDKDRDKDRQNRGREQEDPPQEEPQEPPG